MKIKSIDQAKKIIKDIEQGLTVEDVKNTHSETANDWFRFSGKAYSIYLKNEKKLNKEREKTPHVSSTSNKQIDDLIEINNTLADYALLLPAISTAPELDKAKKLIQDLPITESDVFKLVSKATMSPRIRMLQKEGRIKQLEYFKPFTKLFDAAILSFYRGNFISCYMTLVPIVEGVIIRWMGYNYGDEKPDFFEIKKFFKNPHTRQPCPFNIQFHEVYNKVCDKILNKHFYQPSSIGTSYDNFNRHSASHLLIDDSFATKENCVRLFLLLDTMTEIFVYESRKSDPRFTVSNEEISKEIEIIVNLMIDNGEGSPEDQILGTSSLDLF